MANAHNQFLQFEQIISVSGARTKKLIASRRALEKRIVDFFRAKLNLPIPKFYIQGSYKMGTMVLAKDATYDVDLGIYFLLKPTIVPLTLQKYVWEAVNGHTESGVGHRDKCIRVIYKGEFDIDLPVYYKTPGDEHPYLATKNKWMESDPKELCDWFEKKKDKNGQLVRLIKYFKAWANSKTNKMPSGIALSVWTAQNYQSHQRDDIALLETLKVIKSKFWCDVECINPATPHDDLCSKLNDDQRDNFKSSLKDFMTSASTAIESDNLAKACSIWKQQFGSGFPCFGK